MEDVSTATCRASALRRRIGVALAIYLVLTAVYVAFAPRARLLSHTAYNHYALLADSWLQGRLDLGGPPPPYTGNNDFALHDGKHYVCFPPFPALLLLPIVAVAGSPERVRDGQAFLWLAAVGPSLVFLVLERLRTTRRSARREWQNAALALLFGLGTVYWFTAEQGTVWFAAHVVAVALLAAYLLLSIDAAHPVLAGLMLGLALATRPPVAFAFPFFLCEAWRAGRAGRRQSEGEHAGAVTAASVAAWLRAVALFALPVAAVLALLMWHNHARFGDPTEFGHRLLTVAWRGRIEKWGLFSYHYLGRNLSVVLAGLPFYSPGRGLQVNGHGLALWLTTPIYAWALWPRRTAGLFRAAAASAAAVAVPNLLYQNTGWIQFGYRFSNDFAPLLFLMLALGARRLGVPFWLLCAFSVLVNGFGALTFGNERYGQYYFIDATQRVIHQPD